MREKRLTVQEMFVPLEHPRGDAQADFLVVDLPPSNDAFVKAFPAETTEAFCDGHNAAFGYFGGVPRSILYDKTKLAVARILGDGTWKRTRVFTELQSHSRFAARFGCDRQAWLPLPAAPYEREELIFDPIHYLALLGRGAE